MYYTVKYRNGHHTVFIPFMYGYSSTNISYHTASTLVVYLNIFLDTHYRSYVTLEDAWQETVGTVGVTTIRYQDEFNDV